MTEITKELVQKMIDDSGKGDMDTVDKTLASVVKSNEDILKIADFVEEILKNKEEVTAEDKQLLEGLSLIKAFVITEAKLKASLQPKEAVVAEDVGDTVEPVKVEAGVAKDQAVVEEV